MIQDFVAGITSYGKALQLISRLRLWGWLLLPGLISLLLGIAIFGTAWGVSDNIGDWLVSFYPWEWGKETLEKIASVFGGIFVIAIGLILYKNLVIAIVSPILSPLSEKVEQHLSGSDHEMTFSIQQAISDLLRGITIALRNIIRELFFTFLLFLLGLIPVFSPFTSILIFIVQAYYAGFGNMDYTLERHFDVRNSVRFVRKFKGLAVGNGTVFLLLLFTGIGFLIAPPLGAIAATIENVNRLEK